jgi:hypothetical protein
MSRQAAGQTEGNVDRPYKHEHGRPCTCDVTLWHSASPLLQQKQNFLCCGFTCHCHLYKNIHICSTVLSRKIYITSNKRNVAGPQRHHEHSGCMYIYIYLCLYTYITRCCTYTVYTVCYACISVKGADVGTTKSTV